MSVRDTGIGMTPAILGKIFDPFYQADLSTQRELGGAGLGLAMVKSITELHDGTGQPNETTSEHRRLDPPFRVHC